VIANRVKSPDGRWLALDARTIKRDQRTLSALYHAGLRAELTHRLGVRWHQPENGIAEIADVRPELIAEFSMRTAPLQRRIDEKLDRFVDRMGRDPTPPERWRLEREAVVDSRPAKQRDVDVEQLHHAWRQQVVALGIDPDQVVADAIDQDRLRAAIDLSLGDVIIDWAMEQIAEQQSTWRPAELVRELAAATPTDTAAGAERLTGWIDRLAEHAAVTRCVDLSRPILPGARLRRDGRPVTESAMDRARTTQAILDQEAAIIDWIDRRLAYQPPDSAAALEHSPLELAPAQGTTATAVAGRGDVVLRAQPRTPSTPRDLRSRASVRPQRERNDQRRIAPAIQRRSSPRQRRHPARSVPGSSR
jgi:hypothetical protein